MELGEKILQLRLAAGLSQRQLCGDVITRNMLSQIEHGTAKPSMKTLLYLSERLGKPISYFLEEESDTGALEALSKLRRAEQALEEGRDRYAQELLKTVDEPILLRQKLLLASRIPGSDWEAVCDELPSLDEELFLRAAVAFSRGQWDRCECLLSTVEEQGEKWNFLRGRLAMGRKEYPQAAEYLLKAEQKEETFALLGQCYREMEDYKQAYFYACRQKK